MTQAPHPATLMPDPIAGLEGVVAADTVLSDVDGAAGNLVLRGRRIEDLAGVLPFEDAIGHLWAGFIDCDDLKIRLAEARQKAFEVVPVLEAAPKSLPVLERMQLGLSALPVRSGPPPAVAVSGALPVVLAAAFRLSRGTPAIAPDPALGSAADLLRMLGVDNATEENVAALDRYLVTVLDHGLNASTFTARVIGSTRAELKQAILGAMAALSGPLHGGAPGPVLDMIDEIGSPERAGDWIGSALDRGERIMGFGHRVYRTRDPRADVLKAGLVRLGGTHPKVRLAEAIEAEALKVLAARKPGRSIQTNVEFYTAVLLDAVGIDRSLFTPLFAVGRTPGWCAHVIEQQQTGKLIRPASRYVGPAAGA